MNDNLVGGFNSSEKYWSVGMIIPNIWEELGRYFKKTNKPPTSNDINIHMGSPLGKNGIPWDSHAALG